MIATGSADPPDVPRAADELTCCVVRLVHSEQMASASWLVFFLTCSSWAAWMMASRVAAALLWNRLLALSHSSIWLVLYLSGRREKCVVYSVQSRSADLVFSVPCRT